MISEFSIAFSDRRNNRCIIEHQHTFHYWLKQLETFYNPL
jgi:hypothetical protein